MINEFKGNSAPEKEVLEFMRGVMDEFTHLANFETPVDTTVENSK